MAKRQSSDRIASEIADWGATPLRVALFSPRHAVTERNGVKDEFRGFLAVTRLLVRIAKTEQHGIVFVDPSTGEEVKS